MEQDKIEAAPEWVRFMAYDEDGALWGYSERPVINSESARCCWVWESGLAKCLKPATAPGSYRADWRLTLVEVKQAESAGLKPGDLLVIYQTARRNDGQPGEVGQVLEVVSVAPGLVRLTPLGQDKPSAWSTDWIDGTPDVPGFRPVLRRLSEAEMLVVQGLRHAHPSTTVYSCVDEGRVARAGRFAGGIMLDLGFPERWAKSRAATEPAHKTLADWAKEAPEWARYVAQDEAGAVWAYEEWPRLFGGGSVDVGYWNTTSDRGLKKLLGIGGPNPNWRHTLYTIKAKPETCAKPADLDLALARGEEVRYLRETIDERDTTIHNQFTRIARQRAQLTALERKCKEQAQRIQALEQEIMGACRIMDVSMGVTLPEAATERMRELKELRARQLDNLSTKEQADAWFAVAGALHEVAPGWAGRAGTGMASAVSAIRSLGHLADRAVKQGEAAQAAMRTLTNSGYTYTQGAELWKPPIGLGPWPSEQYKRLGEIFNEGRKSREVGVSNPWAGNTIEHLVHCWGWVQRDLRLALDRELERGTTAPAYQGNEPCERAGLPTYCIMPASELGAVISAWLMSPSPAHHPV